jgi:hypothetical protein
VLQIGVGHEGYDRVEDRRRRQDAQPARVERRNRLQTQDDKAEYEQRKAERNHRQHILLPILRACVDEVLEPLQHAARAIFAVHQPGEIGAERDRQHDRREKEQCREEPHSDGPFKSRSRARSAARESDLEAYGSVGSASSEPLGPDKRSEEVDDDKGGHRDRDERHEKAFQMTSQAKINA